MKKIRTQIIPLIILAFALLGCRGEDGLPGPQGPAGYDGATGPGAWVYEISNFSLNYSNGWQKSFFFPSSDKIYETDVVLVYYLADVTLDHKDVWRLLPINFFDPDGIYNMNFDYTLTDVNIYLESSNEIDPPDFNNIVARIVVIPIDDITINARKKAPVNYDNYEEVKAYYGFKDTPTKGATPINSIIEGLKK